MSLLLVRRPSFRGCNVDKEGIWDSKMCPVCQGVLISGCPVRGVPLHWARGVNIQQHICPCRHLDASSAQWCAPTVGLTLLSPREPLEMRSPSCLAQSTQNVCVCDCVCVCVIVCIHVRDLLVLHVYRVRCIITNYIEITFTFIHTYPAQ